MSAHFAPGDGVAIVASQLSGIIGNDGEADLVQSIVGLPPESPGVVDDLIRALATRPLQTLPSFAFVIPAEGGMHVLVRGKARVTVADGVIEAPHARSWSESFVPGSGPVALTITGTTDDAAGMRYWCSSGLVPASAVELDFSDGAASGHVPSPAAASALTVTAPIEQVGDPVDDADDDANANADANVELDDDATPRESVARAAAATVTTAPSIEADEQPTSGEVAAFTALVPPIDEAPTSEVEGFEAVEAVEAVAEVDTEEADDTEDIDDVFDDIGDHDGLTITIPRGVVAPTTETPDVATVHAVHCPNAHPNPPAAAFCRICGMAISDRTVARIARPLLGNLVVRGTPTSFPIDRPMILGRRPSAAAERDVLGEQARLVPLPDPDQVLSKVHAEIRIDEWDVLVVDRNSRNHTFVTLPAEAMQELEPGVPLRIVPGTSIDLAGTLVLDYETGTR